MSLQDYLPAGPGYLPKWLFFISLVAAGNSLQAYASLKPTQQVYSGRAGAVTPLSARTFGTWTLLSAIVRLYASYYISNPQLYQLAFWSYVIAAGHFYSEWLVFGSIRFGKGLAGPAIVSGVSLVWMYTAWDFYVQ